MLGAAVSLFNDRREKIEAALVPQSLPQRTRKSALSYIGEFYTTINDLAALNKEIMDRCLLGR